jgi:uncharacterized Ntn-hydrolase superfamily protein
VRILDGGIFTVKVLGSSSHQSDFDRHVNAWVCKIAHKAMAASKAAGGDFATQRETAIKAVRKVHPYLSAEDLRSVLYAEC